jgi:hypothetical protein
VLAHLCSRVIFFNLEWKGKSMKKQMKVTLIALAVAGFTGVVQADVTQANINMSAMNQCVVCNAGFVGNATLAAGSAGYLGQTGVNLSGMVDADASGWGVQTIGTMRAASQAQISGSSALVSGTAGSFSAIDVFSGNGYSTSSASAGGQAVSWR